LTSENSLLQLYPAIAVLVSSAFIAVLVFFLPSMVLSKSKLSAPIRDAICVMTRTPLAAGVIGYALILAASQINSVNPSILPVFGKPRNLTVLVELSVLAVATRAATSAVKHLTVPFSEVKEAQRLLVYGVYALGLMALSYILLTSPISPTVEANVWSVLNFFTGLIATYLVVYTANIILKRYATAMGGKEPRLQTTITFVRRLALAGIALLGVSAATFSSFPAAGGLIASLFIAAGFSSIVIGLAAQSSLSNLIAGMVVSVAQPFKIGDAVVFKDEFCFVEDIRLIITVLRTWDNRRLMVPNQLFLNEVVTNYSAEDPTMLAPVIVQIPYESDLDKAMSIMRNVALKHPECLPIGDLPNVVVMQYNESGIQLRLLSRAKDQPTAFQMERDLLYQIRKEFNSNGIEIAYPKRHVLLSKESKAETST
jgi:small conductance mechanosensitive channel